MKTKLTKNFYDRFQNGIKINFADQSNISPSEQDYRTMCITNAVNEVFKALLKKDPTKQELLGIVDISKP